MKKIILLFFWVVISSPHVFASDIAVADADYLMNASEAAKSIKEQLKNQRDQFQRDFEAKQAELRKEEQEIVAKRQNLTEAEFKKQITSFREKAAEEERKFQEKKTKLDEAFSMALQELQKEIGLVLQEVAKEKGFAFVISRQSLLFAAAGQPDVTQEILKRLNERKKEIAVKF